MAVDWLLFDRPHSGFALRRTMGRKFVVPKYRDRRVTDPLAPKKPNRWAWSEMLRAGDAIETPDAEHTVEVVGYVQDWEGRVIAPNSLYRSGTVVGNKPINKPLYVPRAYIEAVGYRVAPPTKSEPMSMIERLDAGEVVASMFNLYRIVKA